MASKDEPELFRSKYIEIRPMFERLAREVRDVLGTKMAAASMIPVSILDRAKTVDSFIAKISRKGYANPIEQTTDLAGVRIVCAYDSEITEAIKVIDANFEIHERIDKLRDLGVDRMGYNGKAVVVSLGQRYAGGRYDGITNLKCEIQVRTILQDAWAIIDHHLVYKNEAATPDRLRRDLNNVASLLEIAQGVFENIREKRELYIQEIQSKKTDSSSFLSQPVDFDTMLAYTKWKFPNLPVSEKLTQIMLRDIDLGHYTTLKKIDVAVNSAQAAVSAYSKENPNWFQQGTDYITKSLGFTDPKFRQRHGFAPKTRAAFDKYKSLVS
jgi:ppGpp synthetase/RelA/SpoT-type nucleotidyltranferase